MIKEAIINILIWVQPWFLWYFAVINGVYTFFIILGSIHVYFRRKELAEESFAFLLQSNTLPEISFLIPVYNESTTILGCIQNVNSLSYRYKQVIIINDGSSDDSVEKVIQAFDMVKIPKLYEEVLESQHVKAIYQSRSRQELFLLDKEHKGKFDAINAGINAARAPFFLVLDADTAVVDAEFEAFIRPLLLNPKAIGVGASIRIQNNCALEYNRISTLKFPKTFLTSMQGIEYIRAFLLRVGLNDFNANFIISGAFSLFSKKEIIRLGGYCDSVGEDAEIVIRLHHVMKDLKQPYKVLYVPDPVAWTLVPDTVKSLGRQRSRWHLAILEALFYHKKMFFNPRYGFLGLFMYPFWIFGEALEPLVEVLGACYILFFVWTGDVNWPFVIFYLLLNYGLVFLYTFYSLITEDLSFHKYPSWRSVFLMFTSCVVENIGYHQLHVYWRIKGYYLFFKRHQAIKKENKSIRAKIAKAKQL